MDLAHSIETVRNLDPVRSSASTSLTPWQGQLQLQFTHQAGKTCLSRSQVQAPLKIQRPFYPEGAEICHGVILHTAGGIVGGDRLSFDICLQPQSQALITTAAAAKIYRSQGQEARQVTRLQVAAGACLEWLPQEAIVFDGAMYRQDLRVELEADAVWLGWDIARLGRSARGERFLSGVWRSRTEVWQQGRLAWVDPQQITGGSEGLMSPHGLAGCPVIASFAFIGQSVSPELVARVREQFTQLASPDAQAGTTRLMSGLLCRYRGHSTAEARRWFVQVWQLLREEHLGRSLCLPRVWQR